MSWGNLMSMALRNELREPADDWALVVSSYNWDDWYQNMVAAAYHINSINPDVLIFFSGLSYDTYLTPVVQGSDLGNGTTFRKSDFPFEDKIVLELHNYDNGETNCSNLEAALYHDGFQALNASDPTTKNVLPMVVTEWGFLQAPGSGGWQSVYTTCLEKYLPQQRTGWMLWVLAGSYYIRSGIQGYDETWGMSSPFLA